AADGESLTDDRAGTEEADPGHDLSSDPRRVGAHNALAGGQKFAKPVCRDDREQRRPDRDEQVRPQAGLAVAELSLEAEHGSQGGSQRDAPEHLLPGKRGNARREDGDHRVGISARAAPAASSCETAIRSIPTAASSSSSFRRSREKGSCSAVACTSTSLPSPVMTTFMSTSALESSE